MSRTKHASKPPGYEYWSRRIRRFMSPGRWAKSLTHRFERLVSKKIIVEQLEDR